MISPEEYRKAQADLDAPITEEDRIYDTQAKKWAARIVRGEDWMPRSLGPATTFYLTEFRKSMNELDPANPEELAAFHRLDIAVQSMLAFTNMELMEQTMAQQPPTAPAAQPQQQAEQQQMPKEASIVDILNQISNGGGSGSSSQPVAAYTEQSVSGSGWSAQPGPTTRKVIHGNERWKRGRLNPVYERAVSTRQSRQWFQHS